jgi:hypothetical protein
VTQHEHAECALLCVNDLVYAASECVGSRRVCELRYNAMSKPPVSCAK